MQSFVFVLYIFDVLFGNTLQYHFDCIYIFYLNKWYVIIFEVSATPDISHQVLLGKQEMFKLSGTEFIRYRCTAIQ